jgi:phage terminase small subunit
VKQAGYSPKWVSRHLRDLLASPRIQARLKELKEKVGSDESLGVMSRQERMIRLSQIAKASITDFMEMGQDGSWVNIGKEHPMGGAVEELRARTEYDDNGAHSTVYTQVKLHDPMKAIDLLNKMDKIYSDGAQVSIDNRKIEIIVVSDRAKELTEAIMEGQRTQLTV